LQGIQLKGLPTHLLATLLVIAVPSIGVGGMFRPLSADTLLTTLEQRFPRADIGDAEGIAGVIALGGNPDRLREAARLALLFPHLKVVVTGAGGRSEVLSVLGPGIGADRIIVEEGARNTYENAVSSSQIIGARSKERWLLVTSASHMPRAMGTFRKVGINIAAWPIFDLTPPGSPVEEVARHEWLGLLAYWVLGRSNSLFPATVSYSR
jgi:uncharacterized SAM-binding protein YcdF (DUF218 family)